MSYQKVIIQGNLGKDPEVRYLDNNVCVATFSVATSEKWKDRSGNQQERTEWWRCVAWDKKGQVVEKYLKKGSPVLLELTKREREYEQNNETKRITEFTVIFLQMLARKPAEGEQNPPIQNSQDNGNMQEPDFGGID